MAAPGKARILALPRGDRRAALADLVAQEVRRALLMSGTEELSLDDNYFDLGLTSLKAVEVKQRLESDLDCELETPVLFASSTVRQIADYLADIVLPATGSDSAVAGAGTDSEQRRLVGDLIRDLYED